MTKIEAIIQPSKFESVKEALIEMGVDGMTASEVKGHGRQKGPSGIYRGREYEVDLLPKIKLEVVVEDNLLDKVTEAIIDAAATGRIGDGKIFYYKIEGAVRIRNREQGVGAL
jgi:nitrogen regulatory protein P-II 1